MMRVLLGAVGVLLVFAGRAEAKSHIAMDHWEHVKEGIALLGQSTDVVDFAARLEMVRGCFGMMIRTWWSTTDVVTLGGFVALLGAASVLTVTLGRRLRVSSYPAPTPHRG